MLMLQINTTPIKTELNVQKAQMQLTTTRPQLQMDTEPAIVEIHQPQGELSIDQYPLRYSYGMKNLADFTRDVAQVGRQTALEEVGHMAEEGDQLMSIENNQDAVVAIATEKVDINPLDIQFAPLASPEIHYKTKPVEYRPQPGKLTISVNLGRVQNDFHPGKVVLQVVQYPSVSFHTVDKKV